MRERAPQFPSAPIMGAEPGHDAPPLSILIINNHLPIFPGTGGHEYLNTTNLAQFARRVGLVSLVYTQDDLEKARRFGERRVDLFLWQDPSMTHRSGPPARTGWVRSIHRRLAAANRWLAAFPSRPLDTVMADLLFRNMSGALLRALSDHHWQVLITVQSSAAAAIDYVPRQTLSVLVMHDIRALVLERQARVANSWRRRLQLNRAARRYYRFEERYARRYDLIVALSEIDADWIRAHYHPARIVTVPIPVDTSYFVPAASRIERPARILFTGLMNHPPNVDAAVFFARDVLPIVRRAVADAEFAVVGKHPTPDVWALNGLPGVTVTGAVPDTRPYLDEATVVVVPLRFGSGVRNKILEAWSMEKFVISTRIGAEGLDVVDGVNLVLADRAGEMAAAAIRAIQEPAWRDSMRKAGRDVARTRHDPKRIAGTYYEALTSAARDKLAQDVPMRVALDMRWMIPGQAGGLENLARSFTRQLIALDHHNAYTALLPARCRYDFDLRGRDNFRIVSADSLAAYAQRARRRVSRALHARLRLDHWDSPDVVSLRFARSLEAEIAYSFPGYIHPDLYPLRHVLMVPDIQHEYFPEFFSQQALTERRRLYGDSIRRADHVCAISEFTRQTLIERLGVAPEKITAIPLAADPIFTTAHRPLDDRAALQKYGLTAGTYLFFAGHTWHHKNHRAAVDALRILRDKHGLTPTLVCTGGAREAQPAIEQQIAASGLEQHVRFLGYCPQRDLPALYRGAVSLVFPSLFEGFGMPVLEAMACGCPVICSNATSLPEIAGEAALLIDPANSEAIADAVHRLLRDGDLRATLSGQGVLQAARFSWQRHTMETVAVLHKVHREMRRVPN
jgi:glycosyltransferase involved in cell wall biosynthesis